MKYKPILKIIGILAPILYLATAIIGLVLKLGYIHIKYSISALISNGVPNKILLNNLFSIYGILIITFAAGLLLFILSYHKSENYNNLGKTGIVFLLIVGFFGLILILFFPMDPNNTPITFKGVLHLILAYLMSFSTMFVVLFFVLWFKAVKLKNLCIYSLISLIVIFIFGIISVAIERQANPFLGLFERIMILAFLQWIPVTAIWIINLKNISLNKKS
jgi:hypothetical protein